MRILQRRKPQQPTCRVRLGVTRGGCVGVGIYDDEGLVGWGPSESAAWASYEQHLVGRSAQ